MSDRAVDNVSALVRRFSRLLHRKITDVLALVVHHKSAGSLGAVAGLTIACIFVWMLLRPSPGRRAGDRRKDRASSSTSQAETEDESPASEGHLPVGPLMNLVQAVASAVERLGGRRRNVALLTKLTEEKNVAVEQNKKLRRELADDSSESEEEIFYPLEEWIKKFGDKLSDDYLSAEDCSEDCSKFHDSHLMQRAEGEAIGDDGTNFDDFED